jgi:glycine betaine catabolism A
MAAGNLTLSGNDYRSHDVYELERARIFHREWHYAGREDLLGQRGDRLVIDVAGESVLIVRERDDYRAFYNVCRHRGSQLCDDSSGSGAAITCPYHGWSYALSGELIGTPNVGKDEVDRGALSLWPVAVEAWQGFLFVSLAASPVPLRDYLARNDHDPLHFERFDLGAMRTVTRTTSEVAANWKILIENYCECLHCSRVHPELVDLIPIYRGGGVSDPDRADAGVSLSETSEAFTTSGYAALQQLLGDDQDFDAAYYGALVYPNMFIDITGPSAAITRMVPSGPAQTTVHTEYLFTAAAIDAPGFDPQPVIDFNELTARQDFEVCERVQRGVSSRAFTHGVYADKDDGAVQFVQRYLAERDAAATT